MIIVIELVTPDLRHGKNLILKQQFYSLCQPSEPTKSDLTTAFCKTADIKKWMLPDIESLQVLMQALPVQEFHRFFYLQDRIETTIGVRFKVRVLGIRHPDSIHNQLVSVNPGIEINGALIGTANIMHFLDLPMVEITTDSDKVIPHGWRLVKESISFHSNPHKLFFLNME